MTLKVEITRNKKSRVLSAHVVQGAADGQHKGRDLLSGRKLSRIPAAQNVVKDFFRGCGIGIAFDVKASPDVEPTYKEGYDRNAVRREVES